MKPKYFNIQLKKNIGKVIDLTHGKIYKATKYPHQKDAFLLVNDKGLSDAFLAKAFDVMPTLKNLPKDI